MDRAGIELTLKNLKTRGFDAYYADTKEEALALALSLIPKDGSVSWGGSETIKEMGLMDAVKSGGYNIIDRDKAKTPEERMEIMRESMFCDTFLMSANGISEEGVLINIDGMGNRVAALTFGPRQVIVAAGTNKLRPTVDEALWRARNIASPKNVVRLKLEKAPCHTLGHCANCHSEDCICASFVFTRFCRIKGRIKVILVGEELGY